MDRMPIHAVIFQSIPESIIILCLGLACIGIRPDFRKVLPAAILSSMVSWLVRGLPLPFGLHSIIGLVTIISLFLVFFKTGFLKAIVAALFALSSLLATEALLVPVVTKLIGISGFTEAWDNSVYRVVLAFPEQVLLGGIAYLLIRFQISFQTVANRTERYLKKEHVDK